MTPEDVRKTWREAASRFYAPTPDEFETMYRQNKETALERLAKKYLRFSRLGIFLCVMAFFYLLPSDIFRGYMRIWICVAFVVYGMTGSVMDHWLYIGIKSIDCFTMTVKEVVEKAMYYRKKHLQFMMILLPMAMAVVGLIIYSAGCEIYLTLGAVCGVIIGGCIGYRHYLEFMSEYRRICSD